MSERQTFTGSRKPRATRPKQSTSEPQTFAAPREPRAAHTDRSTAERQTRASRRHTLRPVGLYRGAQEFGLVPNTKTASPVSLRTSDAYP